MKRWREAGWLAVLSCGLVVVCAVGNVAHARGCNDVEQAPRATAVDGRPTLALGDFDLAALGYRVEEFFLSGTATSYAYTGAAAADGATREVGPDAAADYTTRLVVVRPADPATFSGTVVVEWLNVTAGFDMPAEWIMVHREIIRRGHAYVGVSAQRVGIEGQPASAFPPVGVGALKEADPQRYQPLSHPGDAFAFDIFSQAGRAARESEAGGLLGPLTAEQVIAAGESQSAMFLTTYVAEVDALAKVYDGFLIHSRFGMAAPLHGNMILGMLLGPRAVTLPADLARPVVTLLAENDVLGWPPVPGFLAARQADVANLRAWEIAGTAHADTYMIGGGFLDSGDQPVEKLAEVFAPTTDSLVGQFDQPINSAPQHHYVAHAALWQLVRWVKTGQAAPVAPPLEVHEGSPITLATDEHGLATGGVRTPWVDVPTTLLSGVGNSGNALAGMVGVGTPFDAATINRLYPGGKADYLAAFEPSLDAAIQTGFLLADDREEILAIAAINFDKALVAARSGDSSGE